MDRPTIIVGFDSDPGAAEALRWALAEAGRHDARVVAIYAYQEPVVADVQLVPPDAGWHLDEARRAAHAWRDAVLAELPEQPAEPVEVQVRAGPAGPALIDAAAGALMLVVGARQQPLLHRLIHGSVSRYCTSHPPCPVVAVPDPRDRPAAVSRSAPGAGA